MKHNVDKICNACWTLHVALQQRQLTNPWIKDLRCLHWTVGSVPFCFPIKFLFKGGNKAGNVSNLLAGCADNLEAEEEQQEEIWHSERPFWFHSAGEHLCLQSLVHYPFIQLVLRHVSSLEVKQWEPCLGPESLIMHWCSDAHASLADCILCVMTDDAKP